MIKKDINEQLIRGLVRNIPDFPKKGILFRDITPILNNKKAFKMVIDIFYEQYKDKNIDKVVGIESRGFIFGAAIAYRLKAGFIPVRKPSKLPAEKIRKVYNLEYGQDALEMHVDSISKGENILIVDDLLATGGTVSAVKEMVEDLGGKIVSFAFLIELDDLYGRKRLEGFDIFTIMHF